MLHGLAVLFVLLMTAGRTPERPEKRPEFVPVDVVETGGRTTAPPAPQRAQVPLQKAMRGAAAAPRPEAASPSRTRPPQDELEVRLKTLAHLRRPDSDLRIENGGASDAAAASGGEAAGPAAYSVRDYIRAQVLRRWSLDIAKLAGRDLSIPLHVVLTGNGTVVKVEVLDRKRYKTDASYRDIALSARNAVLLSAPFKLTDRARRSGLDFTLELNPRDTLR